MPGKQGRERRARQLAAAFIERDGEIAAGRCLIEPRRFVGLARGRCLRAALGQLDQAQGMEGNLAATGVQALPVAVEQCSIGPILKAADRGQRNPHGSSSRVAAQRVPNAPLPRPTAGFP